MPVQKAVFTTGSDFDSPLKIGGRELVPYQYFDGVNLPNDEAYLPTNPSSGSGKKIDWKGGNPTTVDGIVGNGSKLNSSYVIWHNWKYPALEQATISMWVKFDSLSGWTILATNRGDGFSDGGMHVAVFGTELNVRAYGEGGSVNLYSDSANGSGFHFKTGEWYHVAIVWNPNPTTYDLQGFVNGELVVWGNVAFKMPAFTRSFTVGDLDNGYPFNGSIDEVMYMINENAMTEKEVPEYYEKIKNGNFLDSETVDGALQLGIGIDNLYPDNPVHWDSKVVDLGGNEKFVDFGYIEALASVPEGTSLEFYTRTSADESNWEEWVPLTSDGRIQSLNQRYIQVRVSFISNGTSTPILEEVRIMEDIYVIDLPKNLVRSDDPLYLYKDLEGGLDSMGEFPNAYDLVLDETINSEEKLTFKLPYSDTKRKEIGSEPVEMVASIGNRYFVVKEILDKRGDDGTLYSEFITESRWTELRDWFVEDIEVVEVTAKTALQTIVDSIFYETGDPEFDWTIGNVEITKRRTLRSEWNDVLSLVRTVQNTWGGEILFDTKNKVIHLLEQIGSDTGIRFTYEKNLKTIERRIDTYDLITRIYPTGAGELDIRSINRGIPYIENREWVDKLNLRRKIIPYRWKDERYTIPQNLYEDADAMLSEMSKPNIAYASTVLDLSAISGHEHESFELGDTVIVEDKELFEEEVKNRIVRRSQNIRMPEKTTVELAQPIKTLADIQSRAVDEKVQNLISSDLLSNNDVQQMTVFNQLLNSRGDDGMTNWVHEPNGTEFELANAGFSGNWSYKVSPDYDKQAKMTQSVEGVSHRSSYTVSASVATEGELVRGSSEDAFAGIKVLVYYEGEAEPEIHYLEIPDVTTKGES